MTTKEIENRCIAKQQELLEKYFGNLVHEAAYERPETIGDYVPELPLKVEAEYRDFLESLWAEIAPNDPRPLDDILDKGHIKDMVTEDDHEGVQRAYRDAQRRTLWERVTRSNHKDVTFYKGLLKVYAEELLNSLRIDFIEDLKTIK